MNDQGAPHLVGELRSWLAAHPRPTDAELAAAGWVAPQWPRPWGLDAGPSEAVELEHELLRAGVSLPDNPIGIGWAGPTILAAGTDAQRERFLGPILSNEHHWCQLFSEPDHGSDLASLGTTATLDGDSWIIEGQKIWTTDADNADFGILLARTGPPDEGSGAAPHHGISYFLCPMDRPGIDVRPIREMSGGTHFCEVFFSYVRIGADALLGAEGQGWRLATLTLGNERVSLSQGGLLWGMGPTGGEVLDALAALLGGSDVAHESVLRQRFARLFTESFLLDRLGERVRASASRDGRPGPEASLEKLLSDQHGQRLYDLLFDVAGPAGLLSDGDSAWPEPVSAVAPEPFGAGLGAASPSPVAVGRTVLPCAHHRRWHDGGAAKHHRRAVARPTAGAAMSASEEPIESHDFSCIRFERVGGSDPEDRSVLLVTLDRPENDLNAVDEALHAELAMLFRLLRRERRARAVVLTGSGRAFCAGGDFDWFEQLRSVEALDALRLDARQMIWDLLDVELPIVCALNGHAMGLGASIALLCDLIVMADGARIGDPHVSVGLVAGDGGTVIWPAVLGPARAKQHLLLGDPLDAATAERLGLVNLVAPPDDVLAESLALARRLAAQPPLAVRYTKAAINQQLRTSLLSSFDTATALELSTFLSADHAEAVTALRQKRAGRFEGG